MKLPRLLLLFIIDAYRKVVSPFLPASCRFFPSCSSYAQEAIGRYGAGRGGLMALKRIGRCHPWHPGGEDPLPDGEPFAQRCGVTRRTGVSTRTSKS